MDHRLTLPPLALCIGLVAAPLGLGNTGCLPGDTRPEPASVLVSTTPTEAMSHGFDTLDGYHVVFDVFLMALGNVNLDEDDAACNPYEDAGYDRLFDLRWANDEKVGTVWGLGTCELGFRMRSPSYEALVETNATKEDVSVMRVKGSDRFTTNQRTVLIARGRGWKDGPTRFFEWVFRQGFEISRCASSDPKVSSTLTLESGVAHKRVIEVRPEELFRSAPDDAAPFLFAPFAEADKDQDAHITLEEMAEVEVPYTSIGDPEQGGDDGMTSLDELVYVHQLPRIVRFLGAGPCQATSRSGR